MKTCSKCGETKELTEFSKKTVSKDGLNSRCRDCMSAAFRQWREKNIDYDRERHQKYHAANTEQRKEKRRQWYEENAEHAREYSRKYYAENTESRLEYARQYREDNPEIWRTNDAARRIRDYGLAAENTPAEREAVIEWRRYMKEGNLPCLACARPIDRSTGWVEDHAQPLSRGGRDTVSNVIPCCEKCNRRKHTKDYIEFCEEIWGPTPTY